MARPDPPAPDSLLRRTALQATTSVAGMVMTVVAAFVLMVGGLMLSLGWHFGPEVIMQRAQYAHWTGRVDAPIVERWLALDIDGARVRDPQFWRASTLASPCVVVELGGDWGAAQRRAFCGPRLGFNESYDVVTLHEVTPGVPFAWGRDEHGFARVEVRMAPAARTWLAAQPAHTFMHAQWPARNALEWLVLELDQPLDAAVAGWTAHPAAIPIAFEPGRPDHALPLAIVEARSRASPSLAAIVVGLLGLAVWGVGIGLLPALWGASPRGRIVLGVLPLLALPWFADKLPYALSGLSRPIAEVASDMFGDIDPLDRMVGTAPADAAFANGAVLAWPATQGAYAATFGRFAAGSPPPPLPTADAALLALAARVTANVAAADAPAQKALFDQLRQDKERDLRAAGLVFVPAAKAALLDDARAADVRLAARRFLEAWTTSPTELPDPRLPAYDARWTLWRTLADVPVPTIANLVPHR